MLSYCERLVLGHVVPPWTSANSAHYAKTIARYCATRTLSNTTTVAAMLHCLISIHDTSPFWWPWLAARPGFGNPYTSSIFSGPCTMLYFHFLTSSSPEKVQVWIHRHQQKCYHGVFMPSEHGWQHGHTWSPTKWMGEGVQRTCRRLCWVEDMQGCILSHGSYWLNKFVNIRN